MPYHTIQVSRPFDVVVHRVLELDETWLEEAVRTATGPGAAGRGTPPRAEPTGVQVRVEWPCWERGAFTLPMEWEVTGTVAPWALSGELEVCQVSPGETRIGLKMAAAEPVAPQDPEQSRAEETQRVFWTLEALSRYDLLDAAAPRMPPAEDNERGQGCPRAFAANDPGAGGTTPAPSGHASGLASQRSEERPVVAGQRRRGAPASGRNSMVVRRTR
jgi:hypothetical protein